MIDIKNLKINIEQKILESDNVVIVPHNGIDFDAIGSALGLSLIAKKLKKTSCIVVNDPVYKIEHGVQLIIDEVKKDFTIVNHDKYLKSKTENDLYILTDVNKSYLISVNEEINNPDKVIIIDHHDEDKNTVLSSNKYIDSSVSSASEVVTELLMNSKVKLNPNIADYLLSGIYLDTNKLTKNVSPRTMQITAKLLESGAEMSRVNELFTEDFNSDRRVHNLVNCANFITISLAIVSADEDTEYTKEELAKVADYLLKYKVDGAFAIGRVGENITSISARSKGRIDVGNVMQQLSGGGNKYSAATKLTDCSIEEVTKRLVKVIQPTCYNK